MLPLHEPRSDAKSAIQPKDERPWENIIWCRDAARAGEFRELSCALAVHPATSHLRFGVEHLAVLSHQIVRSQAYHIFFHRLISYIYRIRACSGSLQIGVCAPICLVCSIGRCVRMAPLFMYLSMKLGTAGLGDVRCGATSTAFRNQRFRVDFNQDVHLGIA